MQIGSYFWCAARLIRESAHLQCRHPSQPQLLLCHNSPIMPRDSASKPMRQADCWDLLIEKLSTDVRFHYLIRSALREDSTAAVTSYLQFHLGKLHAPPDMINNPQLFSAFLAHCARHDSIPLARINDINAAIAARRKAKDDLLMRHKHLVEHLGLNWKAEKQELLRDKHLASFGTPVLLEKLKVPYPPISM